MNWSHYRNLIKPEHWNEFTTLVGYIDGEDVSPERQMQLQENAEIAKDTIFDKYDYEEPYTDEE